MPYITIFSIFAGKSIFLTFMKTLYHLAMRIILLALLSLVRSESEAAGFVPVRNFERDAYGGGPQNWCATHDSFGRLLVGNRDGMLMFDGTRWDKFYLSNYTAVRSLLYDPGSGRIYAGGSEVFGFFSPDPASGRLKFHSLTPMLGKNAPAFSEIWNIFRSGDSIWFQGDYFLFRFDGAGVAALPAGGRVSRSAIVNGRIMLGMDDGRILYYDGSDFVPFRGTEGNAGRKVTAILPGYGNDRFVVATSVDGLFGYDGEKLYAKESPVNTYLKENQVFCATERNRAYVFGTVNGGAVTLDISSGTTRYVNKEGGLRNNTVLGVSVDQAGNLWLCLDNGLAYARLNSPLTTLVGPADDIGAGYAALRSGPNLYLGTNRGLYATPYPFPSSPSGLRLTKLLQGQTWSLSLSGHGVFAAMDGGLFHDSGSGFRRVGAIRGAYKAVAVPGADGYALASTYDRFHLLRHNGTEWTDLGPVSGYDDIGGDFRFDMQGLVWLPHFRKGIYRMKINIADMKFDEVRLISDADGLADTHNNSVEIIGGQAVFSVEGGFCFFNPSSNRVMPHRLNKVLGDKGRHQLFSMPDNTVMMVGDRGIEFIGRDSDGIDSGAFRVLSASPVDVGDMIIPGYLNVCFISDREIVVSNQEGFWLLDRGSARNGGSFPSPFVSAVRAGGDSLVFSAPPAVKADRAPVLSLTHDLNSLRFDFGFTGFESTQGVEFSSFLENYDDGWSPFSDAASREYTRLSHGTYVFRLRARDRSSGRISETSMTVRISPPWYRSPVAHALYLVVCIAAAVSLFCMVRLLIRRAQTRIEARKEKELEELRLKSSREALRKDYEIASLKSRQLEHDIRHKSSELSTTTMNLIRKNEILTDISGRVARIEKMMADENVSPVLRKNMAHIRSAIHANISHDDDWKSFTRNFDVVYSNYTRRLMEKHPNLTEADQRLCCYLRMRLSSKEIAPLVNISYKSVEMARYRLRKKMALPSDVTLTDYLLAL